MFSVPPCPTSCRSLCWPGIAYDGMWKAAWFWGSDLENSLAHRHQAHFPRTDYFSSHLLDPFVLFLSWFEPSRKEGINFRASLTHQQASMRWLRNQSPKDITKKFLWLQWEAVDTCPQYLSISSVWTFYYADVWHLIRAMAHVGSAPKLIPWENPGFFSDVSPTHSTAPGRDGEAFDQNRDPGQAL